MPENISSGPGFLNAAAISCGLNLVMIFSAAIPGSQGKPSLLARFADMIAAPPGVIIKLVFSPKEHTANAVIASAAESLAFSLLFYLIVAWGALNLANRIVSRGVKNSA